jgi:hypothetical protein
MSKRHLYILYSDKENIKQRLQLSQLLTSSDAADACTWQQGRSGLQLWRPCTIATQQLMKDWVQEVTSNVPSGIVIAIACNKVSKRATTCLQQQPRALSLLEISAM